VFKGKYIIFVNSSHKRI